MNEDRRGRAIAAMKSLGKRGRTSRVPRAARETVLSWGGGPPRRSAVAPTFRVCNSILLGTPGSNGLSQFRPCQVPLRVRDIL